MESVTHVLKKSFNLGICRPAVLSFFCCFDGKWVLRSNSVPRGLSEPSLPGCEGPRGDSFPCAMGGEAVFLARVFLGCMVGWEEDISLVVYEGLWEGVADSAREGGWVELLCSGWGTA